MGPITTHNDLKLLDREKSSTVTRHRPCEMGILWCYNTQSLFNLQCVFLC